MGGPQPDRVAETQPEPPVVIEERVRMTLTVTKKQKMAVEALAKVGKVELADVLMRRGLVEVVSAYDELKALFSQEG